MQHQKKICSECGEPMKKTGTYFVLDYRADSSRIIRKVPTLECVNCGIEWIEGNSTKTQTRTSR